MASVSFLYGLIRVTVGVSCSCSQVLGCYSAFSIKVRVSGRIRFRDSIRDRDRVMVRYLHYFVWLYRHTRLA